MRNLFFIISFFLVQNVYAGTFKGASLFNQALSKEYESIGTLFTNGFEIQVRVTMESLSNEKSVDSATWTNVIRETPAGNFWFEKRNSEDKKVITVNNHDQKLFVQQSIQGYKESPWVQVDNLDYFIGVKKQIFDDWKSLYERYKMLLIFTQEREEIYDGKAVYVLIGSFRNRIGEKYLNDRKIITIDLEAKLDKTTLIPYVFILKVEYTKSDYADRVIHFIKNFELQIKNYNWKSDVET